MAQEYRQLYDEDGNVIDPAFWLENNNVFAGEFNGGLDRDNFAQADISAADLGSVTAGVSAFNVLHKDTSTTNFALDDTSTDWQGGAGSDASGIEQYTWTSDEDAHYDLEWGGWWVWDGNYSAVQTLGAVLPDNRLDTTYVVDTIVLRAIVNGIQIAIAGPFEDGYDYMGTHLVGSIQLPAGTHVLKIEALCCRRFGHSGLVDGPCTNTPTVGDRCWVMIERRR